MSTASATPSTASYLVSSYFIAGAVAGVSLVAVLDAASRTAVAPLERLKIIYQCQGNSAAYGGVGSALAKIWREEGIKGMFRGNGINCLRIMPYSAVQFSSYEQFKKLFSNNGQRQLDTPMRLAAGGLAGMCSVVSTYPLDLVRSRISIVTASIGSAQLQAAGGGQAIPLPKEISILGMTSKVFREEGGVRGLYRGIGPTSAGVIPYVAGNFYFYGTLKDYFSAPDESLSAIGKLACGALSGAVSQGLTYPLDVLRRKMQVTGMKDKVNFKYKNSFDAIRTIVQTEGFTGLYRGIYVNMLKVAPAMGISFYAYETTKQWMGA